MTLHSFINLQIISSCIILVTSTVGRNLNITDVGRQNSGRCRSLPVTRKQSVQGRGQCVLYREKRVGMTSAGG